MLLIFSLLISTVHAQFDPSHVFRRDSSVPVELQRQIVNAIEGQCPALVSQASRLVEESTQLEKVYFDQDFDLYFHTDLTAIRDFDGHPVGTSLYVRSMEGASRNSRVDRYRVLQVVGCPSI